MGPDKRKISLLEKAKTLPSRPGCYLMKNRHDEIIYVGKAKSLRSRVSSYFQESAKSPKTEILISHIKDFDFLMTSSDVEAFVLENNLIKKHTPKYNIRLRDDKSYPYVYVNLKEPFARIEYRRRVRRSKDTLVFGPFVQGSRISEVLRILTKSFELRDCTLREFNSRKRPCLLFQMGQCSAPCVGKISQEDYSKRLKIALDIFEGKGESTLNYLEKKMFEYADREEFERAAMLRDFFQTLEAFVSETQQQQNVELNQSRTDLNLDVCAFYAGEIEVDVAIYMIRRGVLLGHKLLHFPASEVIESDLISFLYQYYTSTHDELPQSIVIQAETEKRKLLEKGLEQSINQKIKVILPGSKYTSLHRLTLDYAQEGQRVRQQNREGIDRALNELRVLLGLREKPRLLECYDVAIWQGDSPAASQVVFFDGRPDKKLYRHYHLEKRPEGNNDFDMLREFMRRRILREKLPDVMIVDGGKGQVSALCEVLKEHDCDIPVVGIAKARSGKGEDFKSSEVSTSQERLIIPGRANPYILNKNPALYRIIVQMRDEAHRFSRRLHHKAEKKRIFNSWPEEIEGIGSKTREKILKNLSGSPERLAELDIHLIAEQLKVGTDLAQKIKDYWAKRLIDNM